MVGCSITGSATFSCSEDRVCGGPVGPVGGPVGPVGGPVGPVGGPVGPDGGP